MSEGEQDPLEAFNPLLRASVEAFVVQMAAAFDEVWTRPDATALMLAFLDGKLVFAVARDGITILEGVHGRVE